MSIFSVFDIAASAMNAQSVRINTISSNMANVDAVSATAEGAYRSKQPVFSSVLMKTMRPKTTVNQGDSLSLVKVDAVVNKDTPPIKRFEPEHPLADKSGHVYYSNVNIIEEMANMMSASRSYQANIELLSTTKSLMLKTIQLGR